MTRVDEPRFELQPLASHHDRAVFSCGVSELDEYLKRLAGQDFRRDLSVPWILTDLSTGAIAGYFTLAMSGVEPGALPAEIRRRLPNYQQFPSVIIGRLAVSTVYQGQRLGTALLYGAFKKIVDASRTIAVFAVIVDAKNDAARQFYLRHQFLSFPEQPDRLFIDLKTVRATLVRAGIDVA